MRKITVFIILWLNIITLNSYAISAKSAVVIDSASGRVLYEHNAYAKLPMASTTKIMTGLLACESEKLNKTVKASAFASGTEGSSLWLKVGEKQTLENLVYGLMLKSGNDAAVAIAEFLGGNTDAFAILMNERARSIGALNTNFKNPHGLDNEEHYTTAYDLALIAREAMKNKKFRKIVATKTYSIPMEGEKWDRALKNHNKLLWRYEGCNGIKTGFTKRCGRCLVTSANRNGMEIICVTLNAPDDWKDHVTLLDNGFREYQNKLVTEKDKKVCDFTYDKENNGKVRLVYEKDFYVAVDNDDIITTTTKYRKLSPPSKKGEVAGVTQIFCNGEEVGKVNIITTSDIRKLTWVEKLKIRIKNFFK